MENKIEERVFNIVADGIGDRFGKDFDSESEVIASKVIKVVQEALAKQKDKMFGNVGMLRQLLNEERIKDADRFVDNDYIKDILGWGLINKPALDHLEEGK